MAIQMTAAQYRQQYGIDPVFSTSTIDTTPAPVRMTMKEYNNLYNPQPQTFREDARQDIADTKISQQEAVTATVDRKQETDRRVASGETSRAKGAFQNFTSGLFGAADVLGRTAFGAAKTVLPQKVEDRFGETLGKDLQEIFAPETRQAFITKLNESEGALLTDGSVDRKAGQFLTEVGDAYKNDANFRADVIGAGGVLSWLSLPGTLKTAATKVTPSAPDFKQTLDSVTTGVAKTFGKTDEQTITKLAGEISNIENKYKPLRTANKFSPDADASRARIASSNVLENAVDTNGLLRTEDAAKAYRSMPITQDGLTLKDLEGVVRRNLENENKSINLRELERDLIDKVMNTKLLEGGDLTAALKGIGREIEGLAQRADEFGDIPLYKIQDAKIATTGNINFNTPAGDKTYRKALARGFKEIIENKSDLDVKKVNSELAKYYRDIERIEKLDGRREEGGRLGKYSAALAGSAVGSIAGSTGGPLGAAIGGILGGEASSALKGRAMSKTFKSGLDGKLTNSDILSDAQKAADAGPTTNLNVPDKALGAPQGVPKTKEITQLESRIKNNVAEQKKAIKAGDFTLVETLKVIYAVLIDKLKEQIKFVKENAKSESGFANFLGGDAPNQRIPRQRSQTNATANPNNIDIDSTVAKDTQTVKADIEDSIIVENLMRLDNMDVDPIDTIRLDQLKKIADRRPLNENEMLEARAIVENNEGPLPKAELGKAKSATTQTTLLEEAKGLGKTKPQFHGSANIIDGKLKPSDAGILGKGFYMTGDESVAKSFAQTKNLPVEEQLDGLQKVRDTSIKPNIYSVDTSKVKLKELDDADGLINYLNGRSMDTVRLNLIKEGFDGISLTKRGESVVFPEMLEKIKVELKTKSN